MSDKNDHSRGRVHAASWHERLSQAVFGRSSEHGPPKGSLGKGEEGEAEEAHKSSKVGTEGKISDHNEQGETNLSMEASGPIPVPAKGGDSYPTISSAQSRIDSNQSTKPPSASPSPSPSRRKNLAAILSSWVPSASTAAGAERNVSSARPALRSARSSATAGSAAAATTAAAAASSTEAHSANSSDGSKSPSIGSSIKSLHERHKLHREAGETYKSMRADEVGEASGSARRTSTEVAGNARVLPTRRVSHEDGKQASQPSSAAHIQPANIPEQMSRGEVMLKVTNKKVMQRVFRLDSDRGQILWDSKKKNKVNLESIREVRTGEAAASYRSSMSISPSHESRWISIIYQTEGVYKALHLITLSDESFSRWKETLSAVQVERKMLMSGVDLLNQRQQLWLRQHWKAADASENSRLEFDEITKLCRRLGILSNGTDLLHRFKEADTNQKGFLDFEDFQRFVTLLKRRIDVEILFLQWADSGPSIDAVTVERLDNEQDIDAMRGRLQTAVTQAYMSANRLTEFLRTEQGYDLTSKDTIIFDIIKRYGDGSADEQKIGYTGFLSFLMSNDSALLSDQCPLASRNCEGRSKKGREAAQTAEELIAMSSQDLTRHDMSRPLSEYYISSSHNTYLVGGQWKGDSTVEGYVRALLQGARSVEIDCWDGPNNEPQVTHGRTLTTKVSFRDVITAIERYAFISSPYPLILSLEVHNEVPQQDALANILCSVLGEKLLSNPLDGWTAGSDQHLPSPQELKGKILVKAKNLLVMTSSTPAAIVESKEDEEQPQMLVAEKRTNTSTTDTTDTTESESSEHILKSARELVRSVTKRKGRQHDCSAAKEKEKKVLISPRLASLLIYTVGVKHRGINKKEHYAVEHMISLSERSGIKYLKSDVNCDDLVKHNRTHLTRVYPSMSSFKRLSYSANFIPNLFWCMGCQLVAINWQTMDVGHEMNQAMFARNAKCGYVLKPEALRLKDATTAKASTLLRQVSPALRVQIKIRVISAQQLPRFRDASRDKELEHDDVIDPFVSLCIVTPPSREFEVKSVRTQAMKGKKREKELASGLQSFFLKEPDLTLAQTRSSASAALALAPSPSPPLTAPSLSAAASSTSGKKQPQQHQASWLSRQRTSIVKSNGFNPIWNETFTFALTLHNPSARGVSSENEKAPLSSTSTVKEATRGLLDLCFLRFEVGEDVKMFPSSSSTILMGGEHEAGREQADSTRDKASVERSASQARVGRKETRKAEKEKRKKNSSGDDDDDDDNNDDSGDDDDDNDNDSDQGEEGDSPKLDSLGEQDRNRLATYMISLGSLEQGYRHVPLYDAQLSQYLFSTLFVKTEIRIV